MEDKDESSEQAVERPTHAAYWAKGREDPREEWQQIGVAWGHADGKGMTVSLDRYPDGGRIVLRVVEEGQHAAWVEGKPRQKFPLGQVVVSRKARLLLTDEEITAALARHGAGDWGTWPEVEDNELGLRRGRGVSSRYPSKAGKEFDVTTNGRRSLTDVALRDDEEYPEAEQYAWDDIPEDPEPRG